MLIGLTTLPPDHIELQTDVVFRFTHNVQKQFEQNAQMYEQNLCLFEEKIIVVTKKLELDIHYFVPQLKVLECMYQVVDLRKNRLRLRALCDMLKAMEDTWKWINKEEELLKKPKSDFPKINDIHNFLVPFAELMR